MKKQNTSNGTILRGFNRVAVLLFALIVGFGCSMQLSAQNITVDNMKMNVGSGYFVTTDGNLKIQNSGQVINDGTVRMKGDFTNDANGFIYPSPGVTEFNGTTVQTVGGTNTTTFFNLVVNNSNGINLSGNIIVEGTLTFTSGKINTGAFNVILGTSASVAGAGAGKYVNGNLRRMIPATANLTTTFDIGDATTYAPVTVTFVGTPSGASSINASTSVAAPAVASGISQTQYVNRQWNLTNNGVSGFTSYSPTFNFVAGDLVGSPVTSSMVVRKLDGSTWAATTTGAQNATNTQATGVTTIGGPSTFAIGNVSAPSVTCPANILASNTTGLCANSSVTFAASSSSLPAPTITYSQNPGTSFPVGTTNVIVTATNINGTVNCNFDVVVQDTQFPTITPPADVAVCFGTPVVVGTPTAADNCAVSISSTGGLPSYPVGTTVITWTATDPAGNQTSATQNIVVNASPVGSATSLVMCDGSQTNIALNSTIPGSTFTWTSSVTTGTVTGLTNCATGCGSVINNTLSNNGNPVHGVVTYTVTPSFATCNGATFTVAATVGAAPATPVISGVQVLCNVGATTTYSIAAVPEATSYTWTVPTGLTITAGQNTTSITVSVAAGTVNGNVTITATNSCGSGVASLLVTKYPLAPSAIVGPTSLCGLIGTQVTYSTTTTLGAAVNGGNAAYTWTLPTGMSVISGAGTTSIVAQYNTSFVTGTVKVTANNACSFPGTPTTLTVTGAVPAAPVAITGVPANVCGLASTSASVASVTGATSYVWSVTGAGNAIATGQGTTAVTVTLGGTAGVLSCMAHDTCGNGAARTVNLVVTAIQPGAIAGSANTCGLPTVTYSVTDVTPAGAPAYTYTWQLPAFMTLASGQVLSGVGNTSITVNITGNTGNVQSSGGTLKVSSTNTCGSTSALRTLAITRCANADAMNNGSESVHTAISNVYPNPASSVFTLDVTTNKSSEFVVEVYDLLGNLVVSEKHSVLDGTTTLNTDISFLNDGMYFVKLLDAEAHLIRSQTLTKN